jgi:hypothetical protein
MKSAMLVALVLLMVLSHPSIGFGAEHPFQDSLAQATRLAEKGDPEGQYQLGKHFDYGWGVKRNPSQAAKWYEKAATQGHIEAQHALGLLNTGAGSYPLATPEESAKWFRAAAEQGHASSQHFLGQAYEKGKGVTRSYEEAAKWYERAAVQGNGMGMHGLASLYACGLGVKKNLIIAYAWNNVAATQGWGMAVSYRNELEKLMTPDQIKEAQRLSIELHKKYGQEKGKWGTV